MKPILRPSPAVIMHADQSIYECVYRMREKNVGSILIVDNNGDLVGIFTERDLLKHVDIIQQGRYWQQEVGKIMSKPVVTLPASELHEAGNLMIMHGFRHLPITTTDEKGHTRLMGVISMRDLFRDLVQSRVSIKHHPKGQRRIAYISLDVHFAKLVKDLTEGVKNVVVSSMTLHHLSRLTSEDVETFTDYTVLILDLDKQPQEEWPNFLRRIIRLPKVPHIVLAYDPALHKESEIKILQKLKHSKSFRVFQKPVDIFALVHEMLG